MPRSTDERAEALGHALDFEHGSDWLRPPD